MKILTRYVLIEILKIFVISLALTTFFLVVVMGAREALRSGLPAMLAVEVLPYLLPEVLGITIPICVLLAVTVFFSRFAGSNELLCLLSAGISPLRIIWPVLTWATLVSLATVLCYEASATWGRPGMRQRVLISVPRIAVARLQMEKSFRTPAFSVVVKEVQGQSPVAGSDHYPGAGQSARDHDLGTNGRTRSRCPQWTVASPLSQR